MVASISVTAGQAYAIKPVVCVRLSWAHGGPSAGPESAAHRPVPVYTSQVVFGALHTQMCAHTHTTLITHTHITHTHTRVCVRFKDRWGHLERKRQEVHARFRTY